VFFFAFLNSASLVGSSKTEQKIGTTVRPLGS
jgi:hypothetical protein